MQKAGERRGGGAPHPWSRGPDDKNLGAIFCPSPRRNDDVSKALYTYALCSYNDNVHYRVVHYRVALDSADLLSSRSLSAAGAP
jgi:hypothetical protein